ncbi:MAG: STAS-like domain-containing protein [Bacteroidetes bacterium]|nr:STAS-like domain-containing protein [Bacteroidota bacterium]
MTTLSVIELIGTPNAILHQFGMETYYKASEYLQESSNIIIDFNGIRNITSSFFHASIGNLYRDLGETFYERVILRGIDGNLDWQEKIQDSIDLVKSPERAQEDEEFLTSLFSM